MDYDLRLINKRNSAFHSQKYISNIAFLFFFIYQILKMKILKIKACFPQLYPLLQSIHCEMHICVLERNDIPAVNLSIEESKPPPNALDMSQCFTFANVFGLGMNTE